ncbi:Phytochelatins synthase [Cavenderia fasciculata]|uniref:glutathione gamma-glutamylcysteinyltransferase n=1 Tax=Cavenderia fasciculata TaxID=261658 RepID=F4QB85_CACFS|nr:Phytochelatins synthase [Cavenderia fasciculata]EGG14857.1 Phytochelatins synthase [Cavenderia fasciculata]|eukprot:XP_004351373.1 Phytochelatins synthase [Cavenderia fasciculata]
MFRYSTFILSTIILLIGLSSSSLSYAEQSSLPIKTAPSTFTVDFKTTIGTFTADFHRDWAPIGVDHLYSLLQVGYYNNNAFYDVIKTPYPLVAGWGINGTPAVAKKYNVSIPNDPTKQESQIGTISFEGVIGSDGNVTSRTTTIFVNLAYNWWMDGEGYAPMGIVTEGFQSVVQQLYSYPFSINPDNIYSQGNAYLQEKYPKICIEQRKEKRMTIIDEELTPHVHHRCKSSSSSASSSLLTIQHHRHHLISNNNKRHYSQQCCSVQHNHSHGHSHSHGNSHAHANGHNHNQQPQQQQQHDINNIIKQTNTQQSQINATTTTTMSSPAPSPSPTSAPAAAPAAATPNVPAKAASFKPSFYQRPLPSHLIAFSSDEGRKIFREALGDGHMEGYFSLSEQFVSQSDPAYCGLATLAMVLNALKIDPKRLWKGPWRWFAEDMLDCCTPIESVKKRGITFTEFTCLSRCNGAKIKSFRGDETDLEHFRQSIIDSCSMKSPQHLVISYNRKVLGQTGSGHYSPIGGYHQDRDLALVLDVARFKYSPHWVPVQVLWESMLSLDPETKKPRGYYLMSTDPTYQPSFCRVKNTLSWAGIADTFLNNVPSILGSMNEPSVETVIKTIFKQLPQETAYVLCAYSHELYNRLSETVGSKLSWKTFFQELSHTNIYRKLNDMAKSGDIEWSITHHHDNSSAVKQNEICNDYPVGLATIMFLSLPAQMYSTLPLVVRDQLSLLRSIDELNVEVINEIMKIREEMFQVTLNPCACKGNGMNNNSMLNAATCNNNNNNNNINKPI